MKTYVDQMNQIIRLGDKPNRIISLVPSQTELLHDLGLEEEVVGITKFCIHPNKWFRTKNSVGGTKNVNFDKVKSLNPDLIIGNKEENSKEDIEELKKIAPVWMSDIFNLKDALISIAEIGKITGKESESLNLSAIIQKEFKILKEAVSNSPKTTVLYFIWNEPRFVAGKNTFIDDMLTRCGLINLSSTERYPEVEKGLSPDYIFLSSEPYPFKEKHVAEFQKTYTTSKIIIVDGEMFSWYGSRLKFAPKYFMELLK